MEDFEKLGAFYLGRPYEDLEIVTVKPKKTDISLRTVALAWAPYWRMQDGSRSPAWE